MFAFLPPIKHSFDLSKTYMTDTILMRLGLWTYTTNSLEIYIALQILHAILLWFLLFLLLHIVVQVIIIMSDSESSGHEFEFCDKCWKGLKNLTRAYIVYLK